MNALDAHLSWPRSSPQPSFEPPLPRILAVRDTADVDGSFFLPFLASAWHSSSCSVKSAPDTVDGCLHWVSCGPETSHDVESTLSKHGRSLKFGPSPLHQFVDVAEVLTESPSPTDAQWLKKLYTKLKRSLSASAPALIVIDDASFLLGVFPEREVVAFMDNLFALSHSKTSPFVSIIFRIGADSSLSVPSTSVVNVAGVRAGAVDCKHIGLGGVVGTSSDADSSAFDVAKEESSSTPTPSTRGDFSALGRIGSAVGFSRHADIVCDFTPLPSGFSREAYGNLKVHHVPSSRSSASAPISLNYQILDTGAIKAVKVLG
mmetsp:Transcript_3087/g.5790  ORF Transcript_3087/g.5790 Transcript_3087/m.5790 type:complete len:318 (+) Transcript_3087:150-1103(+)